jgi:LuxR family maltose regulon positive regulatory protein
MATPLLTTKLYIPPPLPNLVERPRLIERLNAGLYRKLTLISAPAGFGKTTLVSEWITDIKNPQAASRKRVAWLSLDESDNDLARFLAYFIAALGQAEGIEANIGEGALGMLQSPQPPPTEAILTSLVNEIAALPDRLVLVLDDYHLIETQPIHDALTFLLEYLPPQMHLAIATRDDPHLTLARLRARGQLTELRAADLRFTSSEAAEFLNQVMGLDLSAEDIAALETRTEGWIAGLQMAALALQGLAGQGTLSMQGRADTASFIQAFTGSHRFILDYLVEEVLQRQPEHVRSFLLQTSILDRLTGPLCDAVRFGTAETPAGQEDGKAMLEALERGNLFVVPLDDKRQWYRYHHLFADVLHSHLTGAQPDRVPTLHGRASEWYEHNGSPADAVRHALAAKDFERAAGLVELEWPAMDSTFRSATWLGWVKALPDELVRARPVLSVGYAWALLDGGELEAADARLRDAEWWLETAADKSERSEAPAPEMGVAEMVVVDEEQFRSLPASIVTARTYHAQALGDVHGTVKYARQALDLLPEGDHLTHGQVAALLGLAYWTAGNLEPAHQSIADGMDRMQKAGNILFAIGTTTVLAYIREAQGHLREAVSTYEQSLQLAAQHGEAGLQVSAGLHLGLSGVHLEQGDLEAARQHLLRSEELGEQAALPDWPYRWRLAQARLKAALADLDGALDLLDEAERLYYRTPLPDVRPITALKTRVWIRQGRLTEALGWARERGLSVDDDLSYLREFEHLTLARLLIAEYKGDQADRSILEAMGLLERLLKAAEEGRRMGSAIEILVLQALAHEAQGNIPLALAPLERALALAESEGYVRIFVDEGQPMARLLYEILSRAEAPSRGIAPDYVHQLLAAFPDIEADQISPPKTQVPESELVEPLSEREIEVLQLIAEGLTNQEVATRLYLSLHTVKVHARNIYGKLGVKNRTQAVAKGKALGILSHT